MVEGERIEIHPFALSERGDELSFLSDDERAKLETITHPRRRREYAVSRRVMRTQLGDWLGRDGRSLKIAYGKEGKPFLPDFPEHHFNLSHSDELGVLAFGRGRSLGVDVEIERAERALAPIAASFFAPEEEARWRAAKRSVETFYRYWAAKEAYLKALGTGMTFASSRFVVELSERVPGVTLLRSEWKEEPQRRWSFWERRIRRGDLHFALALCWDAQRGDEELDIRLCEGGLDPLSAPE